MLILNVLLRDVSMVVRVVIDDSGPLVEGRILSPCVHPILEMVSLSVPFVIFLKDAARGDSILEVADLAVLIMALGILGAHMPAFLIHVMDLIRTIGVRVGVDGADVLAVLVLLFECVSIHRHHPGQAAGVYRVLVGIVVVVLDVA